MTTIQMNPIHCWMNIKNVSRYTGLSISTIRRAIQKGHLKCSKRTGKLLFKKNAIDGWLGD